MIFLYRDGLGWATWRAVLPRIFHWISGARRSWRRSWRFWRSSTQRQRRSFEARFRRDMVAMVAMVAGPQFGLKDVNLKGIWCFVNPGAPMVEVMGGDGSTYSKQFTRTSKFRVLILSSFIWKVFQRNIQDTAWHPYILFPKNHAHWLELFQPFRDILAAKAALETGEHGRCKTIS